MLALSHGVVAQFLDNRMGQAFTDQPFFNTAFIRANKIHFLNGQFTYKRPGEVMRLMEYKNVYEFDTLGRLVANFETRTDDGTVDTTWNTYVYDTLDRLIKQKKGALNAFNCVEREYDPKGRIVREIMTREYLDSLGTKRRTVLNSETMFYEDIGGQHKKTVHNNYNLPYMHITSFFNELGYLTEQVERYAVTFYYSTIKYEYTEKGWMASIKKLEAGNDTPTEEIRFIYDEFGNLTDKQIYRNGIFTTEISLIYNTKTKLLSYALTREVATNFIMILGFKDYVFY